jgi:GNAT superfamily N-acetyltransferase
MELDIVTSSERPDLGAAVSAALSERWPPFIFHSPATREYLGRVQEYFAEYDILLLDEGRVAAGGWGVPFSWDGTPDGLPAGYDEVLGASVAAHDAGLAANAFSFMAVVVASAYGAHGLATRVLQALIARAADAGLARILAPVRPTWKPRYPLASMAEYATWTREDGLSIDPWIRVHQRMGAQIVGVAPRSMVIAGTVAEWESWADMPFPVSGSYVVPGALNLVEVDRERDRVTYDEENLWMRHR